MSDYLSDEEQVERLKSWWSENGTSLLASLLVAVLGIAGWNYYGSYQEDAGEQSSEVLDNIQILIWTREKASLLQ